MVLLFLRNKQNEQYFYRGEDYFTKFSKITRIVTLKLIKFEHIKNGFH